MCAIFVLNIIGDKKLEIEVASDAPRRIKYKYDTHFKNIIQLRGDILYYFLNVFKIIR